MTSGVDKSKSHSHNNNNGKQKDLWDTKINVPRKCSRHSSSKSHGKTESVLSTDSDIRFTRRKLGDNQKCGCVVIAVFLLFLLLTGVAVYIGYTYFRPDLLPDRVFRARIRVIEGDEWTPSLADQSSLRFQHKAQFYRSGIDTIIRQSDLRNSFTGSEILALDGNDDQNDLVVLFNLRFDAYRGLVSSADLLAIFAEEFNMKTLSKFSNLTFDSSNLEIYEVLGVPDTVVAVSPAQDIQDTPPEPVIIQKPPRRCEPVGLAYCQSVGYNVTSYPNLLGHRTMEEAQADLISFRELVDAECFRQAYDFVCRLLQPPCYYRNPHEPTVGAICREYCQAFQKGCGNRLPEKLKNVLECERFPESTGALSCHAQPNCAEELQTNALSNRLCDGIADCPDLSDEMKCTYCPPNSLYCGRGRACVPRTARCDGKLDCPDGSDERDCLLIAPLVAELTQPEPISPQQGRFYSEGYAIFSEKGSSGKLCTEGLDSVNHMSIQRTVAESLCKALGYERVIFSEIRNDTELNTRYVRVLDPRAQEISFVRTDCPKRETLYVSCENLECGVQSILSANSAVTLPKMAAPGDWPWHVTLHRDDTHVCDGTLISENWVLTTESCFQGQPKATWIAVIGNVRLSSSTPWTQRRRIVGMVKSPVEGSTAALIRLETPVVYSDFIRPICLPDELNKGKPVESIAYANQNDQQNPLAEMLNGSQLARAEKRADKTHRITKEDRQYFIAPQTAYHLEGESENDGEYRAAFTEDDAQKPKAEAMEAAYDVRTTYLPHVYDSSHSEMQQSDETQTSHQWTTCNTLGWSRQREHLQRVQLKIGDMAACENVSIATVNSMCTETAYHKQDCTEEEFAGSPVLCMLPDGHRWALVGIASWRIACAQSGVERPRMYDKITPNSAWIRDTINTT